MSIPLARALEAVDEITGRGVFSTWLSLLEGAYAVTPEYMGDGLIATMGSELSSAGYARQAITWSAPVTNGDGYAESSNTNAFTFGPFTDPGGSGFAGIGAIAVVTVVSGTAGTVRWGTPVTPEMVDVVQNDTITIAAGLVKVTCR